MLKHCLKNKTQTQLTGDDDNGDLKHACFLPQNYFKLMWDDFVRVREDCGRMRDYCVRAPCGGTKCGKKLCVRGSVGEGDNAGAEVWELRDIRGLVVFK